MTEQQPYELVRIERGTDIEVEVRRYPRHVVAETEVSATFDDAGSRAFRSLFGYISGANTAKQSVEMTAPVVQSRSERIAMTAPVTQNGSDGTYTIAFVLPASLDEASAPQPDQPEVTLRTVPARLVAAARFSGRWRGSDYATHRAQLLVAVRDGGMTVVGEPWSARFDPPYTPWFMRHNEVLVEIVDDAPVA